jgi:hypothetical protein
MLVVGENSYCTVEEATQLIHDRFMSNNSIRKFWDDLDNSDKETLLVGSTLKYDNDVMLYKGIKQSESQSLQFPRINNYGVVEQCPDNIKLGIIIQGCRDSISEGSTEQEMINSGVKSFADGTGARIEFATTASGNGTAAKTYNGINRDLWIHYFAQYSLMV